MSLASSTAASPAESDLTAGPGTVNRLGASPVMLLLSCKLLSRWNHQNNAVAKHSPINGLL